MEHPSQSTPKEKPAAMVGSEHTGVSQSQATPSRHSLKEGQGDGGQGQPCLPEDFSSLFPSHCSDRRHIFQSTRSSWLTLWGFQGVCS